MGENVTFSCATSHQFIIWEVTFTDPTIGPRMQIFRSSNDPKSFIESVYDQQLHFQLISTANGVIESILVVQASTLMENATIQCEGSEIRRLTFRLACNIAISLVACHNILMIHKFTAAPGIPTGVALNNEIHYANVTLTWDEPGGRVDKYNVNVLTIGQTTLNFSMTESRSRLTLDEIPYNQDITVTVSAVNCVAESEKVNILFVIGTCIHKHFDL